jgi:sulfhydrogenase subunit beta (sulfur reductase)
VRDWRARRGADGGLEVDETEPAAPRYAFGGVRSCDLHAVAIQDRVFLGDRRVEPDYEARRR